MDNPDAGARKIILGIDPGTNFTGYGVLAVCGNKYDCIALGYIDLSKAGDPYAKLRMIFERVSALVKTYHPDEAAFESPFFGENVQSMLKLGRAQGVAMAAALTAGIPVYEYAPRKVKQSITGSGAASKEQVAALLKKMLGIDYSLKKLDSTDGLAVAVCHYFEASSPLARLSAQVSASGVKIPAGGKKTSWESYVGKNPGRVVKKK